MEECREGDIMYGVCHLENTAFMRRFASEWMLSVSGPSNAISIVDPLSAQVRFRLRNQRRCNPPHQRREGEGSENFIHVPCSPDYWKAV